MALFRSIDFIPLAKNACFFILLILSGKLKSCNLTVLKKANSPISIIESGKLIDSNEIQFSKTLSSILVILPGSEVNITSFNLAAPENADFPIYS